MKLRIRKESGGGQIYTIMWIGMHNQLSMLKFDTEKEVLSQYKHLRDLNHKINYIAIYKHCEVVGNE